MKGEVKMKAVENPMVVDHLWSHMERTINDNYHADVLDEELEVECACCGEIIPKEDAAESEMWEDQFLCDDIKCSNHHYKGWKESMEMQKYYI